MPTSRIASISNDVATGRNIKRRDGFIRQPPFDCPEFWFELFWLGAGLPGLLPGACAGAFGTFAGPFAPLLLRRCWPCPPCGFCPPAFDALSPPRFHFCFWPSAYFCGAGGSSPGNSTLLPSRRRSAPLVTTVSPTFSPSVMGT